MSKAPVIGLILTGGGARAAYQVGVLQALAQIRRESAAAWPDQPGPGQAHHVAHASNPFDVIAGTSAGAINAAALACRADDFDGAVATLVRTWANFRAAQVYRTDTFGMARTGARWLAMLSIGWVLAHWRQAQPRSLLDNSPLRQLLTDLMPLHRLHDMMAGGYLKALAVTASGYSSGMHVTFYDTLANGMSWNRSQRVAVHQPITIDHLLASSAIPFVFPAVPLGTGDEREYFGDGSMRQSAPISPAIHLGAERIFIVGAGRMHEPPPPPGGRAGRGEYPNLAQIAGHALSNIFLDALAVDIERLHRINKTLSLLAPEARARSELRSIGVLVVAPSQRLDDIAARHLASLPRPVRTLLHGVGVSGYGSEARGAALASYLLFESAYTQELMALGIADTLVRREEITYFFGWNRQPAANPPITNQAVLDGDAGQAHRVPNTSQDPATTL
jgi:NTE family protein